MSALDTLKAVQTALGVTPDGVARAITKAAFAKVCEDADYELRAPEQPALHPVILGGLQHNDWPSEAHAASFFGYPPNLVSIPVAYPMRTFDGGKWHEVTHITCNAKVADSLKRIFEGILAHYGTEDDVKQAGLDVFDGCYNNRNVRGSSSKRSMHAYGAAIDINAEKWPLGSLARMPDAVVAIIRAEGWRYGGDYTGRKDGMHFEACR